MNAMAGAVQDDLVKSHVSVWGLGRRLWPQFRRQKGLLTITLIAIAVLTIGGRVSVWLFGKAVDSGILKHDHHSIMLIAAAYLLIEILQNLASYAHMFYFAKLGNRVLYQIRSELVEHIQALPIPYFDKNPSGRIMTRITNDVVSLGELFTQGIITVFSNSLAIFATAIAMFLISWKMAVCTLAVAPPLIWFSFWLSDRILLVLRDSKTILARINAFVAENISGMRVLQLYQRVARNQAKFDTLSKNYRDVQMKSVYLYALLWPTMSVFTAISVSVALYYGGIVTREGALTTGSLIAFIIHVRDFISPLRTILEKYQTLQNSLAGAERVFTLLDEKQEVHAGEHLAEARVQGLIEFRNVNFRYSENLPWVLQAINLRVEPGQSIALVGRTGSGKTTIISLLQRFYDLREGEILLDGTSFSQIAKRDLRRRIGVVQQDTFMFRGTIASNISLGDPSIPRERILDAARRASCDDLLRRHAGGIDARVEERGTNLSFGERQLIAFARVLAFDPDILILDEATANIDSQSEAAIQSATHEVTRGRTSIIIAHRISTVVECDKIVVLDHGRIVEVGTHAELLRASGIYAALCKSQFGATRRPPSDTQI